MTDARGELPDPAAASGLLHTLRAGRLDAPMLAPTEPRWVQLRFGATPGLDLRDRFRGALVGGAIGDAMGRPNEGVRSSEARARRVRDYQPWQGYRGGPKGTITDDTQMTMWLAEAIVEASQEQRAESRDGEPGVQRSEGKGSGEAGSGRLAAGGRRGSSQWEAGSGGQRAAGRDQQAANGEAGSGQPAAGRRQGSEVGGQRAARGQRSEIRGQRSEIRDRQELKQLADRLIDPEDLAKRFTREHIRGIGQATREFVHNFKDLGKPWHEAGVPSAGNGTAMRAAPVGLLHLGDPYRIYRDSLLQSVVTHRDSMAIAAAACQAYAVAHAASALAGWFEPLANRLAFCADLAVLLDGLERPGYEVRGGSGAPSLVGRIGTELPQYLRAGTAPFADWYNGAYVLESLPCALWCFLASPDDFEQTLFSAVDAGHDADTVAAMACSVAGAYHGYARLPATLVQELEYRDRLIELADGLYDLNRRLHGPS